MDAKLKPTRRNTHRISLNDDLDIRYWTERVGVSKVKLAEALRAVGNNVTSVEKYLSRTAK